MNFLNKPISFYDEKSEKMNRNKTCSLKKQGKFSNNQIFDEKTITNKQRRILENMF